ncbi:MAG: cupin domain-containing protein [Deltaproteobacteria bacterium]|uniref:Cupin domain-containing protein n=1 Tax=Candidatus Zymogenus saltonus TaxID=2844893 RepID=A0A9D8KFG7_9DELT|nr:cupin domain-containing protein [Candidatus Zymogenus saltonus]
MKVISLKDVEKIRPEMEGAEGVLKQVPIGLADGSPNFSFRVFTIEPGGHTPYHTHPFEHINYVIEGRGEIIDGKGDAKAVSPGDFALIKPNEKHQYRNSADAPLMVICAVPKEYE